jgi:hypothetical protein
MADQFRRTIYKLVKIREKANGKGFNGYKRLIISGMRGALDFEVS